MLTKIEKILNIDNDENYNMFKENYNDGLLSNSALYNILKKEYDLNSEQINKLKKELDIRDTYKTYNKKFSFIISTYNRKLLLKECIDSILSQTYANFEIIIVDDCSSDGTEEFIKEKYNDNRILYMKNPENKGVGYTKKRGYDKSTGAYIIFCDDDDYYIDDTFLEKIAQIFENQEISLICSNSYTKFEKEKKYIMNRLNFDEVISSYDYLKKFQFHYTKPPVWAGVFRKEFLDKSDFNSMEMVNDSSIYMRYLLSGGNVYLNKNIIGVVRVHSKNISFNIKADFLIENLNEKKYVYNKIKERKIFSDPDKWLEKEAIVTVKYFLDGSNPTKDEKRKVINWIDNNIENSYRIKLKLSIRKIKRKLTSIRF